MCYCCVGKGRVPLCKQSTPSVVGNPITVVRSPQRLPSKLWRSCEESCIHQIIFVHMWVSQSPWSYTAFPSNAWQKCHSYMVICQLWTSDLHRCCGLTKMYLQWMISRAVWRWNTKLNWEPNAFADVFCLSGHGVERILSHRFSSCTLKCLSRPHTRLQSQCTARQQPPVMKWHQ